ncbi:amphiphysin-like [Liolophura sinensis]|uniref:amphiphysin-like n=1 Tax=Liolophura sinensis TaxID=3198878 RepID=UPI0031580C3A
MADHGKGGKFLAKAQKQLFRTKAKVLQNLGKADKTTDTNFDDYVTNFAKLQGSVSKLQKELKNYIMCAKGMAVASKAFCDVLLELYEPDWTKESDFKQSVNSIELLWNNYLMTLESQVNDPIATYLSHFPPLKAKVAKRGRKLVDYDSARHTLEALQNTKKKDEAKIAKAKEELNEAKRIYEDLNKDLSNDLPRLHESRGSFYASTFQNYFSAENIFHENVGKINGALGEVADKLAKDNVAHVFVATMRPVSKTDSLGSRSSRSEPSISNGSERAAIPESDRASHSDVERVSHAEAERVTHTELDRKSHPTTTPNLYVEPEDDASLPEEEEVDTEPSVEEPPREQVRVGQDYENITVKQNGTGVTKSNAERPSQLEQKNAVENEVEVKSEQTRSTSENKDEERTKKEPDHKENSKKDGQKDADEDSDDEKHLYQVPTSNEPVATPPPGVLFQVCATHPYTSEDGDELSFEAGEVIFVIEYEDPEEQDEGWLMGIKQSDGLKGVFPENFTKRM